MQESSCFGEPPFKAQAIYWYKGSSIFFFGLFYIKGPLVESCSSDSVKESLECTDWVQKWLSNLGLPRSFLVCCKRFLNLGKRASRPTIWGVEASSSSPS